MAGMTVLTTRALNRTLLTRQLLMRRTDRPVLEVVEHLVAMQSQEPNWPYIGLWTRMSSFHQAQLDELLENRLAVRGSLMRSTQHLAGSADYRRLRPTIQPVLDGTTRTAYFTKELVGIDPGDVVAQGTKILSGRTMNRADLGADLHALFPGRARAVLAGLVQCGVALIHPPPNGSWGKWGTRASTPVALAEEWLGEPMAAADVDELVLRYLAAFGPATVKDVQAWSGLTRLREVVDRLRPRLRVLRDADGRELVDLPDAPITEEDAAAPVRFIPGYDNLLLGHADRGRVIRDADKGHVFPGGALVRPTVLVDGFVEAVWSVQDTSVVVTPFHPFTDSVGAQVIEEGERLLAFIAGDDRERWRVEFS